MRISYTIILFLIVAKSFCQKKPIDIDACNNWEHLEEMNGKTGLMSADGNFIMFKVARRGSTVTTLSDLKLGIEKRLSATSHESLFDADRKFCFQLPGDTLVIFDTKKSSYSYIAGVKGYFIIKAETGDKLGYYTLDNEKKNLTIWDVRKNANLKLNDIGIEQYWINKKGTALLTQGLSGLTYTNLQTSEQWLVAEGSHVEDAAFSESGKEIAYISKAGNRYYLKYFNVTARKGGDLINDSTSFFKSNWRLEPSGLSFGNNENNVFFKVSPVKDDNVRFDENVITRDVDVWSYRDLYLQDRQLSDLNNRSVFTCMINIESKKITQIESEQFTIDESTKDNSYFVLSTPVNDYEYYWNKEKKSMFLFSSKTGNKTFIKESLIPGFEPIGISPNNKFLIWFDGNDGNYYSYNIANGKVINISRSVDGSLRGLNQRHRAAGLIANADPQLGKYWIDNGRALIVYARNDIWLLDPSGIGEPVNLTNGYGDSKNIRFKLIDNEKSILTIDKEYYLAWGFNYHSKQNGFWKIDRKGSMNPIKLIMSDDAYYFMPGSQIFTSNAADPTKFKPIKAAGQDVFVVRKSNAREAPNLYVTIDFEKFNQISNVDPKKDYSWIEAKLISYKLPNGQKAEGILHIPGNLDTTKKYPIIFNFYERRSECLNVFRTPELSGHNINIPWYVSREYLVFEPDFYYERGNTSQSVINAVTSAIESLSKLPYVDTARMGAQGQSFGGYETNVLAIQTHFFKAACEMAGPTNIISEYGSLRPGGFNNQFSADRGQRNLGVYPWEHPEVFIKNSPVFHIGNAKTPLLIVHNKNDDAILFSQAIELYLGMRRLGKTIWMLQYDRGGHNLIEENEQLDFTIRMQQFFDHYLKRASAPKWMTVGIPAKDKGHISGLDLDPSGKCSQTCPVCNSE